MGGRVRNIFYEFIEFFGFVELLGFIELLELLGFIGLMILFTWIEMINCRKTSIRFSGFLFQKLVECLIGETFRVPGVTILSCAVARLFFFFLLDLVKFTV